MSRDFRRLATLAALIATAGCDSILGSTPDELRRIGILQYENQDVVIEVPATATAGAPFEVTIRTYGTGCHRQGETNVRYLEDDVQLSPYDYLETGGGCDTQLQTFSHTATVTIANPGTSTVTVIGTSEPGRELMRVERQVEVQPG